MLNILGMIILIIILFIFILLLIGIRISLNYNKKGSDLKGCFKILIFKKIKVYSKDYPAESDEEDTDKKDDEDKSRDVKKLFELAKPCFDDLNEYLYSFLDAIHVNKLQNHLIIGFDSYADTGKYIGIIWGAFSIVNTVHENARLSAEPSFRGSVIDSHGQINIDIKLLKLVIPTIRLLSKKEIRKLIRGVLDG